VRVDGAKHLYSAAVSRQQCVRTAVKSFKERFFSGSVRALLLHFVEQENLSPEEVDELRRLLASKAQRPEKKPLKASAKSPRRKGTK
jgi:BlaI family penicillinase repressor